MEPNKPADKQPDAQGERAARARSAPVPKPVTSRRFVAPAGGVVEGRAYWLDKHLVIADGTVGVGAEFHGLTGVVEYAKVHEQEWVAGDVVYWSPVGGCLSVLDDGATLRVGVADQDAPNPSATGYVRLDAVPTP